MEQRTGMLLQMIVREVPADVAMDPLLRLADQPVANLDVIEGGREGGARPRAAERLVRGGVGRDVRVIDVVEGAVGVADREVARGDRLVPAGREAEEMRGQLRRD